MLTTNRMQQIMIEADLSRPRKNYTAEENKFRDSIEKEIQAARLKDQRMEFTSELPD